MKTLLSTIGIKTQDTSMPTTSTPTEFNSSAYTSPVPPSSYGQSSSNIGTTSGIHYSPSRDIQNRKAL